MRRLIPLCLLVAGCSVARAVPAENDPWGQPYLASASPVTPAVTVTGYNCRTLDGRRCYRDTTCHSTNGVDCDDAGSN